MPGYGLRRNQAPVAHVRSTEHLRIRVQDLLVKAFLRHSELVAPSRYRREVATEQQKVLGIFPAPQKRDDRVTPVVEVHPLEARMIKIHLVERRILAIQ